MFFFLAFVVAAGVYLLVDATATYLAVLVLLAVPAGVGYYLTDIAGVNDFMVNAFHYLSGVHDPYELVRSFPGVKPDGNTWIGIGVGLVLMLVGFIIAATAAIGVTFGVCTVFAGSIRSVARRGSKWLHDGWLYLLTGLGAVVVTAVIMRMVRYLNLWGHHQTLPPSDRLVGPSIFAGVTIIGWLLVVGFEERRPWTRKGKAKKAAAAVSLQRDRSSMPLSPSG